MYMCVFQDHNCVRELRSLIHSQQQKIADFQQAVAEQRFQINEQKRELQLLKVNFLYSQDLINEIRSGSV